MSINLPSGKDLLTYAEQWEVEISEAFEEKNPDKAFDIFHNNNCDTMHTGDDEYCDWIASGGLTLDLIPEEFITQWVAEKLEHNGKDGFDVYEEERK